MLFSVIQETQDYFDVSYLCLSIQVVYNTNQTWNTCQKKFEKIELKKTKKENRGLEKWTIHKGCKRQLMKNIVLNIWFTHFMNEL